MKKTIGSNTIRFKTTVSGRLQRRVIELSALAAELT